MRIFITLMIFLSSSLVQAKATDQQQWLNLIGQGSFISDSRFGYYLELQPRRSDRRSDVYETLLRPAISFSLNSSEKVFLGYLERFNENENSIENRWWLQYSLNKEVLGFNTLTRLRLENRDISTLSEHSKRARAMFRVNFSEVAENLRPFYVTEFFYNLNTAGVNNKTGLSQTRNSAGLSYRLNKMVTSEIGYLQMYSFNMASEDQLNHVLNLALIINFN